MVILIPVETMIAPSNDAPITPVQVFADIVHFYPSKRAYIENEYLIRARISQMILLATVPMKMAPPTLPPSFSPLSLFLTRCTALASIGSREEGPHEKRTEALRHMLARQTDAMYFSVADLYPVAQRIR